MRSTLQFFLSLPLLYLGSILSLPLLSPHASADAGAVQFATASLQVEEADGFASIELRRSGNLQQAASVFIDFMPEFFDYVSALPGEDFLIGNTKVEFGPGESSKVYHLPLHNDGRLEPTEGVRPQLRAASNNVVIAGQMEMRIRIDDDDTASLQVTPQPGRVSFVNTNFVAYESMSAVVVKFVREFGTNGTLSADFRTVHGSASPDEDYTPSVGTITFLPGEIEKEIAIPLINDDEPELSESFSITLINGPLGRTPDASITIHDDEIGLVFDKSIYYVQENLEVPVSLIRTGSETNSVLVTLRTKPLTAIGSTFPLVEGADYLFREVSKTLTPQSPSLTNLVSTIYDEITEPAEELTFEVETSVPVRIGRIPRVVIHPRVFPGFAAHETRFENGVLTIGLHIGSVSSYLLYVSDDLQNWSFLMYIGRGAGDHVTTRVIDRAPMGTTRRFFWLREFGK